jgi:hypothetical protein
MIAVWFIVSGGDIFFAYHYLSVFRLTKSVFHKNEWGVRL